MIISALLNCQPMLLATTIDAAPADVQTVKLYRARGSKTYPPRMNIARLTVMSLRAWTSRVTPRWSV